MAPRVSALGSPRNSSQQMRLDPDESWEAVVDLLLAGVRERRATEGILAAVRRCGEILQAHLPAAPKALNQLPTALILED